MQLSDLYLHILCKMAWRTNVETKVAAPSQKLQNSAHIDDNQ